MRAHGALQADAAVLPDREPCTAPDALWAEHGWALTAPQTGIVVACILLGSALLAGFG